MPDERILVADDETDVLNMCLRALALEGYQVCGAHNGLEAVEMVRERKFDLLLTDIKMPGMTGLQAFQSIRRHDPDIVGVAITGYGAVDTAIQALKLGMADFLLKPFSLDELSAAIARALKKQRLERENARLKALIPLFGLSQAFMTVTDLDQLLQQVMQVALQETSANLGVLTLKDEASDKWQSRAIVSESGPESPSLEYRLSDSIAREVIESQKPVVWPNESAQDPFFAAESANARVSTAVALPLVVKGEVTGILSLGKAQKVPAFALSDLELLSVLASQAAIAIQNARLFTRILNAYEKLASLDHLKSEFISIAAHELRTPLAEINTYAALLDQEIPEESKAHLSAITRASARLGVMVRDMTDLKFLEAGQVELKRSNLSLAQLIGEVLEQIKPLALGKRQSVRTSLPESPTYVYADGPKLRALLNNLIANAVDFTPKGGEISVNVEIEGTGMRMAVRDAGPAVPQEEWEWIFKPFYQLESSLIREHGGIGVGLAIAKSLVELHGGRIWLESTAGKGNTVYFTIPDCLC